MKFNDNNIKRYLHCKLCIDELPKGMSPQSYASIGVGWSNEGLQIWCERHQVNVLHIDFEGQQHPADLTRAKTIQELR